MRHDVCLSDLQRWISCNVYHLLNARRTLTHILKHRDNASFALSRWCDPIKSCLRNHCICHCNSLSGLIQKEYSSTGWILLKSMTAVSLFIMSLSPWLTQNQSKSRPNKQKYYISQNGHVVGWVGVGLVVCQGFQ